MLRYRPVRGGRTMLILLLASAGLVFWSGHASAYPFGETATLFSQDGTANESFGAAVAISGDGNTAAIGSPGGQTCGTVQVFVRDAGDTWSRQARLIPPTCSAGARFGSSMGLSTNGNRLIVGSPGSESVSVFSRSGTTWNWEAGWSRPYQLIMGYGTSVDISGDGNRVIIGAPLFDYGGTRSGRAYLFDRNLAGSWVNQTVLGSADLYNDRRFGESVSLRADGLETIIGAPGANGTSSTVRFFYFDALNDSWSEDDPRFFLQFDDAKVGAAVDMAAGGQFAAVGAPDSGSGKGALVPFRRASAFGWTSDSVGPDDYPGISAGDTLGAAVATSSDGKIMLAGAPGAANGTGVVHAYGFVNSISNPHWDDIVGTASPDPVIGDRFGSAVAVSNDGRTAVIGSPGADRSSLVDRGAAYVAQQTDFLLTVSKSGVGQITSNPAGINCGSTCAMTFNEGGTVNLTATPGIGQIFTGWSGACSGTGACQITMNSNKSVGASFSQAPGSISVQKQGLGFGTVTSTPGTCQVK